MPRRSEHEIEVILARLATLIEESVSGLTGPEVEQAYQERYGERLPPRSLRRWLSRLGEEERVRLKGDRRYRRYLPSQREGPDYTPKEGEADYPQEDVLDVDIPLSVEGLKVLRFIRQPLARREPTTYDRDFLDAYDPDSEASWYLPSDVRARLRELGRTPDPERPAGTYARNILEPLLIDLSWSSSRLEGNTYSRADTEELIKEGRAVAGKDPKETQMILNHQAAIEHLVEDAERSLLDALTVRTLHATLAENLMANPAWEGALRTGPVQISDSAYTPIAVPQVIEECFNLILEKARAISDPFEQAFFVMVHLPYLQPFWDANKRTSRIAANIPLFKHNLVPLSFVDVPRNRYLEAILSIYESTRIELMRDLFLWAYGRSSKRYRVIRKSLGEPDPDPDPIRLRYRHELGAAVREVVRSGASPRLDVLLSFGRENDVSPRDLEVFAEKALELLKNLNAGMAGRYGIEPEALEAWKAEAANRR